MKLINGTQADLSKALRIVNKKYAKNVVFKKLDGTLFRLGVVNNKGPGHTISAGSLAGTMPMRRNSNACWHVHSDFFDALFRINKNARLKVRNSIITKDKGNWEDWIVLSRHSIHASDLCECENDGGY